MILNEIDYFFLNYPAQRPTNPGDQSHHPLMGDQLKSEQNPIWTDPKQELLAPTGFQPETY